MRSIVTYITTIMKQIYVADYDVSFMVQSVIIIICKLCFEVKEEFAILASNLYIIIANELILTNHFFRWAPTSICNFFLPPVYRAPYFRNRTAFDHYFWYTCVKWWYLQAFVFCFFLIFIFWVVMGVKGQKIALNKK